MIQLTKEGVTSSSRISTLARKFERQHVLRLPRLLHPDLIEMIASRLARCEWTTRDDGDIAREAAPDGLAPANILNFATNTPEFLDLMRRITGRLEISSFNGRIYRMAPTADHFDTWHSDIGTTNDDRLVGMSINLSPRRYRGGIFHLRDETTAAVLCQLPNTGRGDAILFRISPDLKHMVSAIEGTQPKTAFAGWFRSGADQFYKTLQATP